jgi:hypothetical protein
MNQDAGEMEAAAASFAQHVRDFHRSLPPDEQVLLEQIFHLAEAVSSQAETQGFGFSTGNLPSIRGKEDQAASPQLLLPAVQAVFDLKVFAQH